MRFHRFLISPFPTPHYWSQLLVPSVSLFDPQQIECKWWSVDGPLITCLQASRARFRPPLPLLQQCAVNAPDDPVDAAVVTSLNLCTNERRLPEFAAALGVGFQ